MKRLALANLRQGSRVMAKKVLAIGIDPVFADDTALPQFTPEMFRSYSMRRSHACTASALS